MTPAELRAIRLARGESQAKLAAALGVTWRTVQRWERGTTRIPELAARLLAHLDGAENNGE